MTCCPVKLADMKATARPIASTITLKVNKIVGARRIDHETIGSNLILPLNTHSRCLMLRLLFGSSKLRTNGCLWAFLPVCFWRPLWPAPMAESGWKASIAPLSKSRQTLVNDRITRSFSRLGGSHEFGGLRPAKCSALKR